MPRSVDDCIAEQSARLYHKANNARGSNFARTVTIELGVMETQEENA